MQTERGIIDISLLVVQNHVRRRLGYLYSISRLKNCTHVSKTNSSVISLFMYIKSSRLLHCNEQILPFLVYWTENYVHKKAYYRRILFS